MKALVITMKTLVFISLFAVLMFYLWLMTVLS